MPDVKNVVSNGFALTGGLLGEVSVSEFDNIEEDVELTDNNNAVDSRGRTLLGSAPGKRTYGLPEIVCPIDGVNEKTLLKWWKEIYPTGQQGKNKKEDLVFSYRSEDESILEVRLIGAYPKKYRLSKSGVGESSRAAITVTLSVESID